MDQTVNNMNFNGYGSIQVLRNTMGDAPRECMDECHAIQMYGPTLISSRGMEVIKFSQKVFCST